MGLHSRKVRKDFFAINNQLDPEIPRILVCGNHDVGNTPKRDTIEKYKATFGDDYFSFWYGRIHFSVLNSLLWKYSSLTKDLAAAQDFWLDPELAKNESQEIIVEHISWFSRKTRCALEH